MATPITYLKFKDASSIISVPIYNPVDVTDSSFRIMTSKGLGCFDLIVPTTNTPLRVMTRNGIKGINEALISVGTPINATVIEDFLDNTYNFTFEQGSPYPFNRFDGASPNGNLGYFKSSNQGVNGSSCNVSFDAIIPTGKEGRLELDYIVDSETGYDFLKIYVNEVVKFQISGQNQIGTTPYIPLSVGTNDIRIAYNKDGNSSDYTDTVYINEIRLAIVSVAQDSFNRANATTLGNAETGQTWQYYGTQVWGISGNQAYPVTPLWDFPVFVETGMSNVVYQIKAVYFHTTLQLMWRIKDAQNFFLLQGNDVYRVLNGGWVKLTTFTTSLVHGDVIRIEANGSNHVIKVNEVIRFSFTDSNHLNETKYGFSTDSNLVRFDDFSVTPI